jgi:glycosyltransferase involved in cell wall biosynthesis
LRTVFHLITTIERGGAENQLLILVREQVANGLDVHIVFLKGEPELEPEFISVGAKVHSDLRGRSTVAQPFVLVKLIKGRDVIVHSHLPRAELVALFTPTRFKFFISRHNAEPFYPGAPRLVSNALARMIEIRATKIIAISNAVRKFLLTQGEVRNSYKISVVHYGYRPSAKHNLTGLNSVSENLRIGTISRLTNQKDIPTMMKAFASFKLENQSAKLLILGSGPLEQELKELARKLSIDDSIQFSGRSSKVIEFLQSLDIFMLTSTYEGFGMVLLEAMDAGIPIIASRNSAIPEVLGPDFPGLCESGNIQDFATKLKMLQKSECRELFLKFQEVRLGIFSSRIMFEKINRLYTS